MLVQAQICTPGSDRVAARVMEHAGSEKGERPFYGHALARFTARHRRFARRDAGRRRPRSSVRSRSARSIPLAAPLTSVAPGEATKPEPPFMPSFPMPAFCRSGEGINSNRIMRGPSNRWHFAGSLLSSLSAVCLLAYATAVRTLREAPLPQRGNGKTLKQELAARTRSRRWTWAFCVLSNWPARPFGLRAREYRREEIFDSCASAGWACPAKVVLPAALRGRSGHDRDGLLGYVRRASPQPGINTTHDYEL
jgi:hypothetical protein